MRVHWGTIPEAADFHPETDGWSPIREPSPVLLQFIAVPLGVIVVGLLAGVLYFLAPRGMCGNESGTSLQSSEFTIVFGSVMAVLVLFIPVHEILHALVHPARGRTNKTILGIWPSRLLFYAHYDGVLSRTRFLAVFAAPFVVLSLCPFPLIVLLDAGGKWAAVEMSLTMLALVNALASAGDVLGMLLIAWQVPAAAVVRNRGWRTYWKLPADGSR